MRVEQSIIVPVYNGEKRIAGIDGLRVFGCISIVFWHVYANGNYNIEGFFAEKIIPSWDYIVYLFMMISGFGMCNGYYKKFKNKDIDIETFYKRRYNKVLPFFALLILLDVLISHSFTSIAEGFINLTLIFGFLPNNALSVIGVGWTLGTIFVFYIIFPFFVFLLYNKRRAWLVMIVSILVQILCAMYFMSDTFVIVGFVKRHSFLYCVPYFVGGGLIYLYKDRITNFVKRNVIFLCFICVIATIVCYLTPNQFLEFDFVDFKFLIVYGLWLVLAVGFEFSVLNNSVVKHISSISMEIYLSHMVFFRIAEKLGMTQILGNGWCSYICLVGIMLGVMCVTIPFIQGGLDSILSKAEKKLRK